MQCAFLDRIPVPQSREGLTGSVARVWTGELIESARGDLRTPGNFAGVGAEAGSVKGGVG